MADSLKKHIESLTAVTKEKETLSSNLNAHYTEALSLALVAAHFGITESHLSRSFKSATHFGFVGYVNSLRVSKACRLLTSTDCAVLDIAMQCSFGSLTQFGRTFRALTGTTPLAYRARH